MLTEKFSLIKVQTCRLSTYNFNDRPFNIDNIPLIAGINNLCTKLKRSSNCQAKGPKGCISRMPTWPF